MSAVQSSTGILAEDARQERELILHDEEGHRRLFEGFLREYQES